MDDGTIELRRQDGVWLLVLRGDHDVVTAPRLRLETRRAFAAGSTVVVDLAAAEFLDASILGALIAGSEQAAARANHSFSVVAPPGSVARRLLDLVRADEHFRIFPTRVSALERVNLARDSAILRALPELVHPAGERSRMRW